ncbi:hypothetical protein Pma05_29580 [Plantactinospora mayteni]|uniref:Uncharacterized protein n=1 Tax=Plantactinospora mayteni TaxID=566021 RepID=A0ABQ4EP02_9ACTN|nr:hypothetical protein Pma05_29580 [Plantactinospora mayteni]
MPKLLHCVEQRTDPRSSLGALGLARIEGDRSPSSVTGSVLRVRQWAEPPLEPMLKSEASDLWGISSGTLAASGSAGHITTSTRCQISGGNVFARWWLSPMGRSRRRR